MFWVRLNVLGWPGYAALRSFFFFLPQLAEAHHPFETFHRRNLVKEEL